ncbi:MAG: hypothetical protein WCI02_02695 [Planctomycetota bacterium]
MSDTQRLSPYELLPPVYRLRDAVEGRGALEAILRVIDEQMQMVQSSTRQLLDDFFIETCRPEMVPFLGELVGNGAAEGLASLPRHEVDRLRALRLSMPRRQVAHAITNQKRKGTLPVLEELGMAVTNWYSRANEWYPRVAQFQDIRRNQQLCPVRDATLLGDLAAMGQSVNFRKLKEEGSLERAFSQGSFFSDFKKPHEDWYPKNRDLIRLHLWRLQPMRVTQSRARCIWTCEHTIAVGSGQSSQKTIEVYSFDSIGVARPICNQPTTHATLRAEQVDGLEPRERLPLLLTREELQESTNGPPKNIYYGRDKSFALWEETCSGACCKASVPNSPCTCVQHVRLIRRRRVRIGDLSWVLCECNAKDESAKERIKKGCEQILQILGLSQPEGNGADETSASQDAKSEYLVDPESGLFAIVKEPSAAVATVASPAILASYYYLFSADVGGGEYRTSATNEVVHGDEEGPLVVRVHRGCAATGGNLFQIVDQERPRDPIFITPSTLSPVGTVCSGTSIPYFVLNKPRVIIEIADSDHYELDLCSIAIPAGYELTVRGAPRCFPTIELGNGECDEAISFELGTGAKVHLERLRICNGKVAIKGHSQPMDPCAETAMTPCQSQRPNPCDVRVHDPITRINIDHCTFVPIDFQSSCKCVTIRASDLILDAEGSVTSIRNSIVGKVRGTAESRLQIADSIVDGNTRGCGCEAGQAIRLNKGLIRVERSTLLGKVDAFAIEFAADSIFDQAVTVARQQLGGMRFCYVAPTTSEPDWKTPQQYFCQPAQASDRETPTGKSLGWERIVPRYVSTHYLDPGYCQLALSHVLEGIPSMGDACSLGGCECSPGPTKGYGCSNGTHGPDSEHSSPCHSAILQGAESGSEMGVFHDLYQPQRIANLRQRITEFTPFPMTTELRIEN